jgi:hypothetical protein
MSHIHFEEEQRFTEVTRIWVLSLLVVLAPLFIGLMDDNLGEHILLLVLTTAAAWIPIGIILFISKMQVKIDNDGLHYRFPPRVIKWKTISKQHIASFELRNKKGLYEHLACGYRRSLIRNTIFMNVIGSKYLVLKLNDGKKIKIGSTNAETMEWTLKRLLNQSEN